MALEASAVRSRAYQPGSLALFLAAGAILAALGFEYIGGLKPCPLCLEQRYAYYASLPVLFAALAFASGNSQRLAMWLFALVALAFLANAGLGTYHAGAEWKFWPGPDTCAADQGVTATAGNLLNELDKVKVVRCDEAAIRIAGLSLAGWNVISSLLIMLFALRAAFALSESELKS